MGLEGNVRKCFQEKYAVSRVVKKLKSHDLHTPILVGRLEGKLYVKIWTTLDDILYIFRIVCQFLRVFELTYIFITLKALLSDHVISHSSQKRWWNKPIAFTDLTQKAMVGQNHRFYGSSSQNVLSSWVCTRYGFKLGKLGFKRALT